MAEKISEMSEKTITETQYRWSRKNNEISLEDFDILMNL
jgi:hypothetical protein